MKLHHPTHQTRGTIWVACALTLTILISSCTFIDSLNATPIPITATPIAITATPEAGATTSNGQLPKSGLGEDLLMLFGGGLLLLGIIVVVRRMRTN